MLDARAILALAEIATELDVLGDQKNANKLDEIIERAAKKERSIITDLSSIHAAAYQIKNHLRDHEEEKEIDDEVSAILDSLNSVKERLNIN